MTDILDPTVHEMDQTTLYYEGNRGGYVLVNSHQIELTRAELQALYGRIQDIMAAELIAAGWVEAPSSHGDRWFYLPTVSRCMTSNPLGTAWRIMMEAREQ